MMSINFLITLREPIYLMNYQLRYKFLQTVLFYKPSPLPIRILCYKFTLVPFQYGPGTTHPPFIRQFVPFSNTHGRRLPYPRMGRNPQTLHPLENDRPRDRKQNEFSLLFPSNLIIRFTFQRLTNRRCWPDTMVVVWEGGFLISDTYPVYLVSYVVHPPSL